jgi:MFS family permease
VAQRSTPRITPAQLLVCITAALGFLFDNYELTLSPLTVRALLHELAGATPGSALYGTWAGRLFFIPACVGGLGSLVGGYFIDVLGRRRVVTWTVLLYAVASCLCGLCSDLWLFLVLRCVTVSCVYIEYVAAVAWLVEIFDDRRRSAQALAYAQVLASAGGLLAAAVHGSLIHRAASLPTIPLLGALAHGDAHAPWRYLYLSGLAPALLLIVVRPFLPESPHWEQARREGTLQRTSYRLLLRGPLLRATLTTTVLCACMVGMAYGGLWQVAQIVPRLLEGAATSAAGLGAAAQAQAAQLLASGYVATYELGAIVGRLLLAFLIVRIASRRTLYVALHLPAMVLVPLSLIGLGFFNNVPLFSVHGFSVTALHVLLFFASIVLISQTSFWGNTLPLFFPLHLRGSGESLAYNAGGRALGAACAMLTSNLAVSSFSYGTSAATKLASASAAVALSLGVLSLLISFWVPWPTSGQPDGDRDGS